MTTTTLSRILADLRTLGIDEDWGIELALDLVRSGEVRLTGPAARSVYRWIGSEPTLMTPAAGVNARGVMDPASSASND